MIKTDEYKYVIVNDTYHIDFDNPNTEYPVLKKGTRVKLKCKFYNELGEWIRIKTEDGKKYDINTTDIMTVKNYEKYFKS